MLGCCWIIKQKRSPRRMFSCRDLISSIEYGQSLIVLHLFLGRYRPFLIAVDFPEPAIYRSFQLIRASSTRPGLHLPQTLSISIRRISSNSRSKEGVTLLPQRSECSEQWLANTHTRFLSL